MKIISTAIVLLLTPTIQSALSMRACAQQEFSRLARPPLQQDPPVGGSGEAHVAAADGGLGSTMTLQQQGKQPHSARPNESPEIVVTPAGEPTPALKHRLWLSDFTMRPGSSHLHFARALVMWKGFPAEFREKISDWSSGDKLPDDSELAKAINSLDGVYTELHRLATSEDSHWDHRLRDVSGPALYAYLLPEIQESRDLARVLRVKINYLLSKNDVDGAIDSMRDGLRLAAFIGQGETLVQHLVGLAIQGYVLDSVERLIQLEGCPNMYWALATIPRPLTDVNESIQFELDSIYRVLPILSEAEQENYGEEYWSDAWAKALDDLQELGGIDDESKLALAVLAAAATGPAKKRLIKAGMSAEEVERMPTLRAVLIDASREIRQAADNLAKASYLPGALGNDIANQASRDLNTWLREERFKSGGAALVGLLFPAVQAAKAASVRQEYIINRLMTVEALRMHAHLHNGDLPASLDELDPVPALPNSFSGKPFEYRVRETNGHLTVVLTADVPPEAKHLKQLTVRLNRNK